MGKRCELMYVCITKLLLCYVSIGCLVRLVGKCDCRARGDRFPGSREMFLRKLLSSEVIRSETVMENIVTCSEVTCSRRYEWFKFRLTTN